MKNISIKEIFKKSWSDYKQNWLLLSGSVIIFAIISAFLGIDPEKMKNISQTDMYIKSGLGFIGFIASIYLGITFTRTYLKVTDGQKVKFSDFFTNIKGIGHFFKYLGTVILCAIIVILPIFILGLFLGILFQYISPQIVFLLSTFIFVVCAFIVSIFLMFAANFSAENRYHFFTAIKKSFVIGKKNFWKVVLLLLTSIGINILGAIALGIGLLVTIPLTWLMAMHFYRVADPEVEIVEVEDEKEDIKIA